ncbi:phosphoglycerate mutase family protein [Toxoplasma gondii GT1]|uniref:Phosphoglycerate mutase family protein n=4 Tax=Toxoplasma gondii TaxID=5811 RepID=S7UM57_TOXGG|nr:phosphoglycerate mutase family protein [Toxoplasma gondii GT1]KAF4639720.1 phosphoglycerate mutase family protein [Toxoplasma gondii]KFG56445.1 phosphoglycerate mutase family protein [Toxoplasma gondii FOU]PUA86694.1 phosphoglycerate mutase family protein [Toxoplasma gondii TgCATBr9]
MESLPAAAVSAAAQAAEAAGAALTTGSSSSSLLVFLVPFVCPPSFFFLLLLTFFVFFVASVLLRYLKMLHLKRQQDLLRLAAASSTAVVAGGHTFGFTFSLPALSASTGAGAPAGKRRWISFESLALLALLTKEAIWNVLRKLWLTAYAVLFLCLSGEERGLETALKRKRVLAEDADSVERRTVLFIRHGESVWNATFNRPVLSLSFPLRFCLFWLWELFLAPERDSVLFDSPLSTAGICQAAELRAALRSPASSLREWPAALATWAAAGVCAPGAGRRVVEMHELGEDRAQAVERRLERRTGDMQSAEAPSQCGAAPARGVCAPQRRGMEAESEREDGVRSRMRSVEEETAAEEGKKDAREEAGGENALVLVSSNLRRAISTLLIALGPSVQSHSQTIQILSSLQESTRFPDAFSLTSLPFSRRSSPPLSQLEEAVVGASLGQLYASHLDQNFNQGNKRLYSTLVGRLFAFSSWLFEGSTERQAVIVVGHSRWLRYFFRMFFPAEQAHPAKDQKLSNCGVLKFDYLQLHQKNSGRVDYLIDPRSCQLLRGSFSP